MSGRVALYLLMVVLVQRSECKMLASRMDQIESNSINAAPTPRVNSLRPRDWIKISEAPPTVINVPLGGRVEIECSMFGSPAPVIQWVRGTPNIPRPNRVHYQKTENNSAYYEKTGIAQTKSRLVIECITETHEGFYTCMAAAGTATAQAPATLLLIEEGELGGCSASEQSSLVQPRVLSWSPTTMENMGGDVILPCVAVGNPRPVIFWLDQNNEIINNSRYRILPNGDLHISQLTWADMGELTCVAENSVGKDMVHTFIYPVLNEK